MKQNTMIIVRTPLACRFWEYHRFDGSPAGLSVITLDHADKRLRVLPWWHYGDYAWSTVWPNEKETDKGLALGTPLRAFIDTRELEVVDEIS